MKKVWLLAVTSLVVSLSLQVYAATKNVSNTMHNLANWAPNSPTIKSTNVSEVCVFCHTPHLASETPLWNRDTEYRGTAAIAFVVYSTHYATHPYSLGMETLLCMSCHDGITSMRAIHNKPNTLGSSAITMTQERFTANPSSFADIGNPDEFANINGGISLSDEESYYASGGAMYFRAGVDPVSGRGLGDHPISINYNEVRTKASAKYNIKPATLRFFGDSKDQLECSTCHDPHVDYNLDTRYKPFLAYSNRSSALCFQCHIK